MSAEGSMLFTATFVRQDNVHTYANPDLAREELLDMLDPLRHLMGSPSAQDTSGVDPSIDIQTEGDEENEQILRGSRKSRSELLSVLPHQHFSESDGILELAFSLPPRKPLKEEKGLQVSIKLVVDSAPGCGGIAWPAGQVTSPLLAYLFTPAIDMGFKILSSYLTQTYQTVMPLSNKSVIELGSGTGLVGLVAGKLDPSCKVYITDQAPLLDIMNKNVALNALENNVKVAELDWWVLPWLAATKQIVTRAVHIARGEAIPSNVPPKPDIILAADCVYFEPAFPLLVQTLADLSHPTTYILFCYKKRRKADKRFFSLLRKKFTWAEVDDPNREIYNREAITLLRLHKIPGRRRD